MNLGSPLQGTPGPQLLPGRKCLPVVGCGPRFGCFPTQQLASAPLSLRASSPYDLPLCSETPAAAHPPSARCAEPCAQPHRPCFSLWLSGSPGVPAASCPCCFMVIPRTCISSVSEPPALSVTFSSDTPVGSASRRGLVRRAGSLASELTLAPCWKGGSLPSPCLPQSLPPERFLASQRCWACRRPAALR